MGNTVPVFNEGVKMPQLWEGNAVFNVEARMHADGTQTFSVNLNLDSLCAVKNGHDLLDIFGIPRTITAKSIAEAEVIAEQLFKKFTAVLALIKQDYKKFK